MATSNRKVYNDEISSKLQSTEYKTALFFNLGYLPLAAEEHSSDGGGASLAARSEFLVGIWKK